MASQQGPSMTTILGGLPMNRMWMWLMRRRFRRIMRFHYARLVSFHYPKERAADLAMAKAAREVGYKGTMALPWMTAEKRLLPGLPASKEDC